MTDTKPTRSKPRFRYCPSCGGTLAERQPLDDNRLRLMCNDCDFVVYENPKIVVGAVATDAGRVVLVQRGIEPRRGFWGLPAGYLELGETLAEGAIREMQEETGLVIEIERLLNNYDRPEAGVINVVYLAKVVGGEPVLCDETLAVGHFDASTIPWNDLAFPSHRSALEEWLAQRPH